MLYVPTLKHIYVIQLGCKYVRLGSISILASAYMNGGVGETISVVLLGAAAHVRGVGVPLLDFGTRGAAIV